MSFQKNVLPFYDERFMRTQEKRLSFEVIVFFFHDK